MPKAIVRVGRRKALFNFGKNTDEPDQITPSLVAAGNSRQRRLFDSEASELPKAAAPGDLGP